MRLGQLRQHRVIRDLGHLIREDAGDEERQPHVEVAHPGDGRDGGAADQREEPDEGNPLAQAIRPGSERGRKQGDGHQRDGSGHRVGEVRRSHVLGDPEGEVKGDHVHREERVGEVVEGPVVDGRGMARHAVLLKGLLVRLAKDAMSSRLGSSGEKGRPKPPLDGLRYA
ncbi:hypothetical protein D3C87_1574610 [compost metagenome]